MRWLARLLLRRWPSRPSPASAATETPPAAASSASARPTRAWGRAARCGLGRRLPRRHPELVEILPVKGMAVVRSVSQI